METEKVRVYYSSYSMFSNYICIVPYHMQGCTVVVIVLCNLFSILFLIRCQRAEKFKLRAFLGV